MRRTGIIPAVERKDVGDAALTAPKPLIWSVDAPFPTYAVILEHEIKATGSAEWAPDAGATLNDALRQFRATLAGRTYIDTRRYSHTLGCTAAQGAECSISGSEVTQGPDHAFDEGTWTETGAGTDIYTRYGFYMFTGPWATPGRWTFYVEFEPTTAAYWDAAGGLTSLDYVQFWVTIITYDPQLFYIPAVATVIHAGKKQQVSDGTYICHAIEAENYKDSYDWISLKSSSTIFAAENTLEKFIDGMPINDLESTTLRRFGQVCALNDTFTPTTVHWSSTLSTYEGHYPFTRPHTMKVRDNTGSGPYNIIWSGIKKITGARGPTSLVTAKQKAPAGALPLGAEPNAMPMGLSGREQLTMVPSNADYILRSPLLWPFAPRPGTTARGGSFNVPNKQAVY